MVTVHAQAAEGFLAAPIGALVANVLTEAPGQSFGGRQIGPYQILSLLGAGGMGEVYRARDTKLGRDVAIKTLPTSFASDPERLRRFDREARVLASLNHPHIGAIYGFEEGDGVRALVLELVEGPTLADRLAKGPIPIADAVAIARQVVVALEAAHEKGIIHRDLKPANIKVTPAGSVKVLDFGLAKAVSGDGREPNLSQTPTITIGGTQEGLILGTAAYMSPEQARGKPVDKRADIWAFGCVLYEMLTGCAAFSGATITDTLAAILERHPDWSALPGATPPSICRLLQRCLEKDPTRRLRDIGDARVEIEDASAAAGGVAFALGEPDSASAVSSPSVIAPKASRRYERWLLGGVVVTLALVTGVWVGHRHLVNLPSSSAPPGTSPFRLVVLPFENLSRRPDDEWLAGAFSDSLTLGLRNAENIVIVNRERVLELNPSRRPDPQQVTRALGVRYYVNGSYQRVGDDLKVVARLVEVDGGAIKLQESFTNHFSNLLHIEDDLARRFAAALQQSPSAATQVQTSSLTAYQAVAQANDLYLAGRYRDAIQQLQSAIAHDEQYADAWALLGKSYARLSSPNSIDSGARSDFLREALRASRRAIELSPALYDAHVALAATYQQLEQVESWRIAAQRAIDLNPRLAEAYVLMGDSYMASPANGCARQRDPELAERSIRKALELNPYFGGAHDRLINYLFWAGREEDALRAADEALRLLPDSVLLQRARAGALLWLGRGDELEQQLRKLATMSAPSILDEWELAVASLLHGHLEDAAARFRPVIERGPTIHREIDTGRIYFIVGRFREAAGHLERAFALDRSCATFVDESPAFAAYRDDPVLRALLSKYLRKRSP